MTLEVLYLTYSSFKMSPSYRNRSVYEYYRKGYINQQIRDWIKNNHDISFAFVDLCLDYARHIDLLDQSFDNSEVIIISEKGGFKYYTCDRRTGSSPEFVQRDRPHHPQQEAVSSLLP